MKGGLSWLFLFLFGCGTPTSVPALSHLAPPLPPPPTPTPRLSIKSSYVSTPTNSAPIYPLILPLSLKISPVYLMNFESVG